MTKDDGLPRRVYPKHGRYWYVSPDGKWHGLTKIDKGLALMHRALADIMESDVVGDLMPAVITRWLDERRPEWADKTAADMEQVGRVVAKRFAEFAPSQVTALDVSRYLRPLKATARTHNKHRSVLSQVLSFAASEGLRDGHNPVSDTKPLPMAGRHRIVTDAEVTAIKAGALLQSRNGEALVQMIDLALLTGQRISDVIGLRWPDVGEDGVCFVQGKGQGRVRLLVEWSPALRAAIDACATGDRLGFVLKTQSGSGYRYSGIRSAWVRACQRAGVVDLHIHDLRGRAGVDAIEGDEAQDVRKAQRLLGHKSEAMTRHYTEGKYSRRVKPAK